MTREQIGRALEYKNDKQLELTHRRNQELLDPLSVEVSRFESPHQNDGYLSNPENKRKIKADCCYGVKCIKIRL